MPEPTTGGAPPLPPTPQVYPYLRELFIEHSNADTPLTSVSTAGRMNMAAIVVPYRMTVSAVNVKNGNPVGGNFYVALYADMGDTPAGGARVAVSASVPKTGVDRIQRVPFTAPVQINAGLYWIVIESSDNSTLYLNEWGKDANQPLFRRAWSDLGAFLIPPDPCPAVGGTDAFPRWCGLEVVSVP